MIDKAAVLFGIDLVHTRSEHRHRLAFACHRTAMRSAVYASGQAAENHQAPSRQIAPQPLCHSRAIGSRMARAHDRNSWLRDCFRIPPQVENQRRVIDLLQLLRIGRIVKAHHFDSCVRRTPQFLVRKLD